LLAVARLLTGSAFTEKFMRSWIIAGAGLVIAAPAPGAPQG
jgi:hypothetical protein